MIESLVRTAQKAVADQMCPGGPDYLTPECVAAGGNMVAGIVLGLIEELCPGGPESCTAEERALIESLVRTAQKAVADQMCPGGPDYLTPECVAAGGNMVVGIVNGYFDFLVRTVCGPDQPANCADDEIQLVSDAIGEAYETVYNIICPNGEFFQDCGYRYLSMITETIDELYSSICGTRPETECATYLASGVAAIINGYVNQVAELVCQSHANTHCVENLMGAIDRLLQDACGSIPGDGNGEASGLPPGVSTCAIKVLDTAVSGLYAVCDSINPETCANNVIQSINGVLVNFCRGLPIDATFPGIPISTGEGPLDHPCVYMVTDMIGSVLEAVCDSPYAASCLDNVAWEVLSTVEDACGESPGTAGTESYDLPLGTIDCVNTSYALLTYAVATACAQMSLQCDNVVQQIDGHLLSLCSQVLPSSGNPTESAGLPAGLELCLQKAVGITFYVINQACASTDSMACMNLILDQISAQLVSTCETASNNVTGTVVDTTSRDPATCAALVLAAIQHVLSSSCASTESTCPISELPDSCDSAAGSIELLPECQAALDTVMGGLWIAVALVLLPAGIILGTLPGGSGGGGTGGGGSGGGGSGGGGGTGGSSDCPAGGGTEGISVMTLNAGNGRGEVLDGRIGTRIERMRCKSPGAGRLDGLGRAADVILLQEVNSGDVGNILGALNDKFPGLDYLQAAGDTVSNTPCSDTPDQDVVSKTAILYRSDRLNHLGERAVCTGSNPPPGVFQTSTYFDEESDEVLECATADRRKHWMAAFSGNGYRFSVASVHFPPPDCLDLTPDETATKLTTWSKTVRDELERFSQLGQAENAGNFLVLAGDFNVRRCDTVDQPRMNNEGTYCNGGSGTRRETNEYPWWTSTHSWGQDSVYNNHLGNMHNQYRDGNEQQTDDAHFRARRIDFIFVKSAAIPRSSHDLSCGLGENYWDTGNDRNCKGEPKSQASLERYSDHRLVWAVLN